MRRRDFLRAAMLGSAATACTTGAPIKTRRRPNIVLIMADDLGYECLGCNGSSTYRTPVLDGLAATGMRFDHCYSQPLCTPSRVQIMTGRYNQRNYQAFGVLSPAERTFGHMLKRAGYTTCVTGKWQLYGRQEGWEGRGATPEQAGFDDYCLWQIKERGERYADPVVSQKGRPLETLKDQYGPDVFGQFAVDFIERNQDRPFFVYYPMCLVHDPFVPTPDSRGWKGRRDRKDKRHFRDMVGYMDKVVGRIVASLDRLGLRDDTLVLFTGDNGTHKSITSRMTNGQVVHGGKGLPLDTGTHVPLIANWPGAVPSGRVCDDLVDFSDFVPTFADMVGMRFPPGRVVDGQSFLPQLRGEVGNPRDWVFCHYDPRWGDRKRARFMRDKRWKLYDDGRLFDIPKDPAELRPVPRGLKIPEAEEARARLQQALDSIT
ncbi:MAG: sulfatase-like hydrolase/transferase [bacterium]|nr:sulfatase-like hydrolase/transferase [bacterium]